MGASEWLCLRQDPELAAEVIVPLRPDRNRAAQHRRGPQSLLTHRWREVDSNWRSPVAKEVKPFREWEPSWR